MRILTPANAAFLPNGVGPGNSIPIIADYAITEEVNADFGPITTPLFTPSDGVYLCTLFVKTNTTSASGAIAFQWQQGGVLAQSIGGSLIATGRTGASFDAVYEMIFSGDGGIDIVREVTGFAGGPANYSAYAKFYKLLG